MQASTGGTTITGFIKTSLQSDGPNSLLQTTRVGQSYVTSNKRLILPKGKIG